MIIEQHTFDAICEVLENAVRLIDSHDMKDGDYAVHYDSVKILKELHKIDEFDCGVCWDEPYHWNNGKCPVCED